MEYKHFAFDMKVDRKKREFEGYASTFGNRDLVGDIVQKGAFVKSIKERFSKGLIKILWQHFEPLGMPRHMEEDERGLFVVGMVSATTLGNDALTLMEDGVVDRLSIGYDVIKDDWDEDTNSRLLKELKLWEFSPVTFPANTEAAIIGVKELQRFFNVPDLAYLRHKAKRRTKRVTTFADLPLAPLDQAWDAQLAEGRVRTWAGGPDWEDIDTDQYRQAFLYVRDQDDPDEYLLPFADVTNGRLEAIPQAIFSAAGAVLAGLPDFVSGGDAQEIQQHINQYYAAMRAEIDDFEEYSPFETASKETSEKQVTALSAELEDLSVEQVEFLWAQLRTTWDQIELDAFVGIGQALFASLQAHEVPPLANDPLLQKLEPADGASQSSGKELSAADLEDLADDDVDFLWGQVRAMWQETELHFFAKMGETLVASLRERNMEPDEDDPLLGAIEPAAGSAGKGGKGKKVGRVLNRNNRQRLDQVIALLEEVLTEDENSTNDDDDDGKAFDVFKDMQEFAKRQRGE